VDPRKLLARLARGDLANVSFADLQRLVEAFGFHHRLVRVRAPSTATSPPSLAGPRARRCSMPATASASWRGASDCCFRSSGSCRTWMSSCAAGRGRTSRTVRWGAGGNQRQSARPCGARRLPLTRPWLRAMPRAARRSWSVW